eukprot:6476707-Amphidinium_carterae.1
MQNLTDTQRKSFALPSFYAGGDSGGIGKLLAALKAVDCRFTAAQCKALLGSKRLVDACLHPDLSKRKAILDQEARKLGISPKKQVQDTGGENRKPQMPPDQAEDWTAVARRKRGNKADKK